MNNMHNCGAGTCDCGIFSMDSITPLRVHLSAYYKRSFAFYTIKERLPVTLTKLVDHLVRNKEQIVEEYGEEAREELKNVIGEISKLKYEIQTNKPIPELQSEEPDAKIYNQYLLERYESDGKARFFTTIWLHAECFMYRQLRYFFENTKSLKKFDHFRQQKQDAFMESMDAMISLADYLLPKLKNTEGVDVKDEFNKLMKLNLWSNRCDLSLYNDGAQQTDPIESISKFESCILANHSDKVFKVISKQYYDLNENRTVDFINDNAGYEMFTDLCLADFIITYNLANKICFNLKSIPWFISDTTPKDFRWILRTLINNQNPSLKKLGIRWNKYLRENVWCYKDDLFWTLPLDFSRMESQDPDLYNRLSESKMLIFKGDLNYRKLFGEMNWESTTSISEALQGFLPTKLCVLRTVKADIICGMQKGVTEELDKNEPGWMTTGNYGVIQFAG